MYTKGLWHHLSSHSKEKSDDHHSRISQKISLLMNTPSRGEYASLVCLSKAIIRGESVFPWKITRECRVLDPARQNHEDVLFLCQNNIYNHSETSLTECGKEKTFKHHLWPRGPSKLIWLTEDECRYAESTGHLPEQCHCEVMWWQSRVVGRHPPTPQLNKQRRFRMNPHKSLEWMTDRGRSYWVIPTPMAGYKSYKKSALRCYSTLNTSSNTPAERLQSLATFEFLLAQYIICK